MGLKQIETATQKKKVGTPSKFSPPPTYNVHDNQMIFSLFVEKMRHFPTLTRGDRGYVTQVKCANYFWPGL